MSDESSSSDDECMALVGLAMANQVRTHDMWVRDIFKRRSTQGTYRLVREMALGDEEMYFRYMRMTASSFEFILRRVAPLIVKEQTTFRPPISPGERLSITLRHLATGESHISLSLQYRVGRATISKLIPEVCKAIYCSLAPDYVVTPNSAEGWLSVAKRFNDLWNLPHVVGALDGKHVRIQCPKKTGSLYHNYKGFFSMNLMACCDADLNFLMFDVGQYGSNNDSGVLIQSEMGQRLANGTLNFPDPSTLEGCSYDPLPYFLVGDEIFPLKTWLMRPYPGSGLTLEGSIFNYRQSRPRRTAENTFGMWVNRWRVFHTPIIATPEHVEQLVMAAIALHNFLRKTVLSVYCPSGYVDYIDPNGRLVPGQWRAEGTGSGVVDVPTGHF